MVHRQLGWSDNLVPRLNGVASSLAIDWFQRNSIIPDSDSVVRGAWLLSGTTIGSVC